MEPYSLQVSERRLRPLPQKQRTLHEKILEEIKQERRLRPVGAERWRGRGEHGIPPPPPPSPLPPLTVLSCPTSLPPPGFGSLPCILNACSGDTKSPSCINLSVMDAGNNTQRPRPRVLLKAPTLAEMEEMNTSEVRAHRVLERGQGGGGGGQARRAEGSTLLWSCRPAVGLGLSREQTWWDLGTLPHLGGSDG